MIYIFVTNDNKILKMCIKKTYIYIYIEQKNETTIETRVREPYDCTNTSKINPLVE